MLFLQKVWHNILTSPAIEKAVDSYHSMESYLGFADSGNPSFYFQNNQTSEVQWRRLHSLEGFPIFVRSFVPSKFGYSSYGSFCQDLNRSLLPGKPSGMGTNDPSRIANHLPLQKLQWNPKTGYARSPQ